MRELGVQLLCVQPPCVQALNVQPLCIQAQLIEAPGAGTEPGPAWVTPVWPTQEPEPAPADQPPSRHLRDQGEAEDDHDGQQAPGLVAAPGVMPWVRGAGA